MGKDRPRGTLGGQNLSCSKQRKDLTDSSCFDKIASSSNESKVDKMTNYMLIKSNAVLSML